MTDLAELLLQNAQEHLNKAKEIIKEVDKDGSIYCKRIS